MQRGVSLDGNLYISKNAHLIMPYHPALDRASESQAGARRIGTTGKGVGPAYADKAARVGIRMADLLDERLFREKLEYNVEQKNRLLREIYDAETFSVEGILGPYLRFAGWLAPYITDTALILSRWIDGGASVLFEGAQGTMLDVDHGTYPFITSSSTTAGGAATGTGVPPTRIHGVLGISKAYATRVGEGPFPTELAGAVADLLRARGNEFGSVTGRPRRCGWVDAVALRYATRINGLDSIAITKLDVLDACETVKICTGYRYRGDIAHGVPGGGAHLAGGRACVRGALGLAELHAGHARVRGPAHQGARVPRAPVRAGRRGRVVVSTGAVRDDTILVRDSTLTRWYPSLRGSIPPR